MSSNGGTWIGRPTSPDAEDRTEPGVRCVADRSDRVMLTVEMVEELRRRLREAEAREESGVRAVPETEIEIDVDAPRTLDELDEVLSPLPEIEVAIAPNSESNFYAGFDDEHPDGVFLATYDRLPVGVPVYATVILPGGQRFRTPAIVEWTRAYEVTSAASTEPPGLGLKMCGLDRRKRRMIRSFARRRRPIFYVG